MDFSSVSSMPSTPNADQQDFLNISAHPETSQDATKRRSSSRSIKRRRFDDELVEYSLGIPGASVSKMDRRVRSQSYSSPYSEMLAAGNLQPTTVPQSPAQLPTPQDVSKRRQPGKPPGPANTSRRSKKKAQMSQLSTKDLGRWKPTDDLALLIGVQQTNDLRMIHRGVKFSCRFTVSEIQSRWYALLYNPEISRVAVAAMRNLHPDLISSIRSKALFSIAEEELLHTFTSNSQPTIENFQELLEQNPTVFFPTRTAKSLMNHWQLLKQYSLLPDQSVQPLPRGDTALSFSDAEDLANDTELQEPKDEATETELAIADRWAKKEIRLLENSLGRWQVLVDSMVGSGSGSTEFDKQTLAVLRGRLVRYLMRSREITMGRSTKDQSVDIDLSLEGPAGKISRRQGTIRLRNNGDFFLASEGRRPIYVDGRPILLGNKIKLNNNCVVEISNLRFTFLINQDLVNAIRQESVKINNPTP